jgi:O-6-methylguanine DNA methyltransferase
MSLVMEQERTETERDPRWASIVNRDAAADGTFVYAVRTTGIYCRPSCPSRMAKPVWQTLREIPVGETVGYAEIARRIGEPKAVRAVAQACGANKIAVAIPCHRVVKNDGALSGYRWGVERKRALLEKEAQA